MVLKKGDIIKISFTGKLENGVIFDTTDEKIAKDNEVFNEDRKYEPMTVVVGAGALVPGLEEDLEGKSVGYKGSVTVPPEKGYGPRSRELIETVPAKKFDTKVEQGMMVEYGNRVGFIESVSGGRVKIDYNEPLAGKTLTFEYTIEEQIKDKKEKADALIISYIGPETKYSLEGDTVTIDVPKEFYLDEEWVLGKMIIARFLISYIGLKHVVYKEDFEEADVKELEEEKSE